MCSEQNKNDSLWLDTLYKPGSRASIKEGSFSSSQCFQLWIKLMIEKLCKIGQKKTHFETVTPIQIRELVTLFFLLSQNN